MKKKKNFVFWHVYNSEDVHKENNLTKEKTKQLVGLVFGGIWTTCLAFSVQLKMLSSFSRCAITCWVSGYLLLIRKSCLSGCLVSDVTSNLILGNRLKDVLAECRWIWYCSIVFHWWFVKALGNNAYFPLQHSLCIHFNCCNVSTIRMFRK